VTACHYPSTDAEITACLPVLTRLLDFLGDDDPG
jgi:hypothetical protein